MNVGTSSSTIEQHEVHMANFKWSDMKGVIEAINVQPDFISILTSDGLWSFTPVGDCCAHAYLAPDETQDECHQMIGVRIVNAEEAGCTTIEDPCAEQHDISFYKIIGDKGDITFGLHVEHNGYYGGWLEPSSFVPAPAPVIAATPELDAKPLLRAKNAYVEPIAKSVNLTLEHAYRKMLGDAFDAGANAAIAEMKKMFDSR